MVFCALVHANILLTCQEVTSLKWRSAGTTDTVFGVTLPGILNTQPSSVSANTLPLDHWARITDSIRIQIPVQNRTFLERPCSKLLGKLSVASFQVFSKQRGSWCDSAHVRIPAARLIIMQRWESKSSTNSHIQAEAEVPPNRTEKGCDRCGRSGEWAGGAGLDGFRGI